MGGSMLLTIKGKENTLMTGDPSITFFKSVYRQHVEFSIEPVKLTYDGIINDNSTITFTVPKNADLLSQCYLHFENLPAGADIYRYFKYISFQIGGNEIDRISSYQLYMINELENNDSKYRIYEDLKTSRSVTSGTQSKLTGGTLALPFFFCKNYSNSLPLMSIYDQDVQIVLYLQNTKLDVIGKDIIYTLWADYIYLDKNESNRFIQNEHKILYEQHQMQDSELVTSTNHRSRIIHKFLVKELQWMFVDVATGGLPEEGYTQQIIDRGQEMFDTCTISCNGTDLLPEREQRFFTSMQHYKYHERLPSNNIFTYSFALHPQEVHPSGSVNFSEINTLFIQFFDLKIPLPSSPNNLYLFNFCTSWNFLTIKDGRAYVSFI
tara:strand:- start:175 stop:1311 length:1137 start_codon:yes stop_codon:yes gene_type:complete